jgi:cytochrome c oxidase cbb3-type subunit 1
VDPFVPYFIKSSLAWLAGGVSLGVAMAIHPQWVIYRPAHMHMNLLGFVTMMIFGVGYQLLPRLGGSPLRWRRMPLFHLWIGNIGLALMVIGFFLRPSIQGAGQMTLAVGGVSAATGALLFVINIWRTLDLGAARRAAMVQGRSIPTLQQD